MSNKESTVATLGEDTAESTAQAAAAQVVAKPSKAAKGADDADRKALQNLGFCGDRQTITLPPPRDENEQDFVFVSVNGQAFQIPRGKPFAVPVEVVEVLDNAVETRFDRSGVGRQVHRHQFSAR